MLEIEIIKILLLEIKGNKKHVSLQTGGKGISCCAHSHFHSGSDTFCNNVTVSGAHMTEEVQELYKEGHENKGQRQRRFMFITVMFGRKSCFLKLSSINSVQLQKKYQ